LYDDVFPPLPARARADPDGLAVVDPAAGRRLTWAELDDAAEADAGRLAALGCAGGTVALLADQGWRTAALLHACAASGAALAPLPVRSPVPDLARMLADCRPAALLASAERAADLRAAATLAGIVAPLLTLGGAAGDGFERLRPDRAGPAATPAGADLRPDLTPGPGVGPHLVPGLGPDLGPGLGPDPAPHPSPASPDLCVLYTSGTSGPAKGVRLTLANHHFSALGCQAALASQPGERWLLTLSTHHVGGLAILYRGAAAGQPVVILPRFDEAAVIQALETHRPRLVSLVPAMLTRLLRAGGHGALARTRAILLGGAPAPAAMVREWAAAGLPVCPTYGLTETCSQVATVPPGRAAEMAGAAGLAHPHARVVIVAGGDGAGARAGRRFAEPGAAGEIAVGGPVVSPGYLGAPPPAGLEPSPGAASRAPFRTGDLGSLDASGVLTVHGRVDDAIITGGENVNPEEVEAVLRSLPGVADVAVVGRPDPVYGMVLEALIVGDARPQEVTAQARALLPAFKVPRRARTVDALPRGESGKLLRRVLSETDF
jgi:O-succinylbenzoic acid--CoA ligase